MDPAHLNIVGWLLLAFGALLVGFAKTAVGGAGALAVAAFAAVLPARESTGALLPLLCLGDIIAVRLYHRHADWRLLVRLLPGVLPGLLLGAWFVGAVDDMVMRRSIGGVLLVMSAAQLWLRRTGIAMVSEEASRPKPHAALTVSLGVVAGFATMTANAAGPVTTLYLLLAGLPMLAFLGTAAWFYLVVNAVKIPFSAGLSLLSADSLRVDAVLAPALAIGAALGVALVKRIDQQQFERAALALATVAAAALLI